MSSSPDNTRPPVPGRGGASHRRSGDGWVTDAAGSRHWGLFGAAGLLLIDPDDNVLLQHRVGWSAHGGTWGIPGGALDKGEHALTGAVRESHEEAGVPSLDASDITVLGTHVLDLSEWSYTTVIARAAVQLPASVNDIESLELRWVPAAEVQEYPLHPGFAQAWPELRQKYLTG